MRRRLIPIVAAVVVAAVAPAPVLGSASSPVSDCNSNGRLTVHYSPPQLRTALATMPADVKEYTNCYDVIQRQLLSQLGQLHGKDSGGSSGGSLLPTPVLVVLIVLVLAAAGLGTLALRRRQES